MKLYLFSLLLIGCTIGISNYFSLDVRNEHFLFLNNLELDLSDIEQTYFVVNSLKLLGKDYAGNKGVVCRNIVSGWNGVEELYFAAQLGIEFDCMLNGFGKDVSPVVTAALEEDDIVQLAYAVLNDKLFQLENEGVADAINEIISLVDEEYGSFFLNGQAEDGSPYYAGLALTALSSVFDRVNSDDAASINDLIHTLLDMGENDNDILYFMHVDTSISNLRTTSVLLQGLTDWAKAYGEGAAISEDNINDFAEYFVSQSYVSNAQESFSLLKALTNLNSGVFKKPVVVSTEDSVLYYKKSSDVHIRLTDVFGNPVENSKLFLIKASPVGNAALLSIKDQEVPSTGNEVFSLNILDANPDPGSYDLDFRVVSTEQYQSVESTKLRVMVVVDAEITDGSILVAGNEHEFNNGKKLGSTFSISESEDLSIRFSIRNSASQKLLSVQQALARFTHKDSQTVFYAVIPKTDSIYVLDVDLSLFGNLGGDYEIEIIIGDSHIEKSFKWSLCDVSLSFTGEVTLASNVSPFDPKPEIAHKFREPEKQANAAISSTVSILVIIPLGIFLLLAFSVAGANTSDWPAGSASMATIVFLGAIGAIFLLDYYYWLGRDIFSTLFYTAIFGIIAIFSGNTVLRHKAQHRIGKITKK